MQQRALIGILALNVLFFLVVLSVQWRYYAAQSQAELPLSGSRYALRHSKQPTASSFDGHTLQHKAQASIKHHQPTETGTRQTDKAAKTAAGFKIRKAILPQQAGLPGDGSAYSMPSPAVVVFCYNRTSYLEKMLASLASLEHLSRFTVYISQDGDHKGVAALAERFGRGKLKPPNTRAFEHWQRERIPQLGPKQVGHAWLAQHYRWGLDRAFVERQHSHVIVVEDDMLFSPDFLLFFEAAAGVMQRDPTLWCASSWNDNGCKVRFNWDPKRMFRTSYFPGLGWMLARRHWLELSPAWPKAAWDHWMRLDSTSNGRECVCPEVNRNFNIGEEGANMDSRVFRRYLQKMVFNTDMITDYGDLSYLLQDSYEAGIAELIAKAKPWDVLEQKAIEAPKGEVYLVPYKMEDYPRIARDFKIWPYPRGHFKHVALLPFRGSFFLLADARFCPLLPPELKILPTQGLLPVAGTRHQSCTSACRHAGMVCRDGDFWFINSCEELRKHFPCEGGCGIELGGDIPNYVLDPKLQTYQRCLVNQALPRCRARHQATARLCPCVPPKLREAEHHDWYE